MRRRAVALLAVLGTAGMVYGTSLALVWRVAREDQRHVAGAIVVLGAAQYNGKPSPVLKARLDHAVDLYAAGIAPLIVVTGGVGSGEHESEAMVGRRYLLTRGITDSLVVALPEGKNTDETMDAIEGWVHARGLSDVELVSDAFHLARLRIEAARHGLTVYTSPAAGSPIAGEREWGYFLAEGFKLPVAYLK